MLQLAVDQHLGSCSRRGCPASSIYQAMGRHGVLSIESKASGLQASSLGLDLSLPVPHTSPELPLGPLFREGLGSLLNACFQTLLVWNMLDLETCSRWNLQCRVSSMMSALPARNVESNRMNLKQTYNLQKLASPTAPSEMQF